VLVTNFLYYRAVSATFNAYFNPFFNAFLDLFFKMSLPSTRQTSKSVLIFDACQVGVVLRTVLVVQAVLAVAVMFFESSFIAWGATLALVTGGALPGTLIWLIVTCSLKHQLQRLPRAWQYVAGIGLGFLAGLYAASMLILAAAISTTTAPWLASGFAGGLLAAALVAALEWRAKGRTPAATTAKLAELQSRIRPHFLFNTLNSAIALVRQEPARAEGLLEDLSDLFRAALAEHGESVTLAQELELAKNYLSIEQVRFGDRLQVQWRLDPTANLAKLPPLLLQPLVENAVLHGIEPNPQGGNIVISTKRENSKVVVEISNTLPLGGAPSTTTNGNGIALKNVRDRLSLMYDLESSFHAGIKHGHYVVRIELPV
jgi:two-component system, LytTR family, sensor histidine kinase AlgZ